MEQPAKQQTLGGVQGRTGEGRAEVEVRDPRAGDVERRAGIDGQGDELVEVAQRTSGQQWRTVQALEVGQQCCQPVRCAVPARSAQRPGLVRAPRGTATEDVFATSRGSTSGAGSSPRARAIRRRRAGPEVEAGDVRGESDLRTSATVADRGRCTH